MWMKIEGGWILFFGARNFQRSVFPEKRVAKNAKNIIAMRFYYWTFCTSQTLGFSWVT